MKNKKNISAENTGILCGAGAYTIWGFLPLYWKHLKEVPAPELLCHRIIWSLGFVIIILLCVKKWNKFTNQFSNKKNVLLISLCAILIAINWGVYIWAVNSNHIIEASMGYYINPLISVLLGVTILKEKLNSYHKAALFLAAIGVGVIIVNYGQIPWISFVLALSFGIYGLLKKMIHVDSEVGLALETIILVPFALIYVIVRQASGNGALGAISFSSTILLMLSGIATATPLLLFAESAKRVELSVLGFLQYISPTISLLLGVLVFHENFTKTDLLSFGFIWAALFIFSLQGLMKKSVANEM